MLQLFCRTPLLILFLLSISPFIFIGRIPSDIWAYVNTIIFSFFVMWVFSIIKTLLAKNTYDKSLRLGNFTAVLILVTLYFIFISLHYAQNYDNFDEPGWFLLLIIIGHPLLFFSILYLTNFIAKTISTINSKSTVKFSAYSEYFFLLLAFPIGIWWLYPKIQLAIKL